MIIKSKPVKLALLLIGVFNALTIMVFSYDINIFNYTEFNWKVTDLGPWFCGSGWGIGTGIPGDAKEFKNILPGTKDNPSSTKVTWNYYCPSTIKLTVNPPSYMIGAATNKLDLTKQSQIFELGNDKSKTEFQLNTVFNSNTGNTDIHIRKTDKNSEPTK